MSNIDELPALLSEVITAVFDNDKEFLKALCEPLRLCDIEQFYMASERCYIVVSDWCGDARNGTIRTKDVLDWYDGLPKGYK